MDNDGVRCVAIKVRLMSVTTLFRGQQDEDEDEDNGLIPYLDRTCVLR